MEVNGNALLFAKVREDAIIPSKSDENAGYDIYANFEGTWKIIYPGETSLIPTGIACAMTENYYMQIQERGSTGSIGMKYSAGVIDSGYRGEIFVAITNCSDKIIVISKQVDKVEQLPDEIHYPYTKAIAQGIIHKVHKMDVKEISYDELKNISSKRGDGKLGSSRK